MQPDMNLTGPNTESGFEPVMYNDIKYFLY